MSWREVAAMGGYALYVWGAYALTLTAIGGELVLLYRRGSRCRQQMGTGGLAARGESP